MISLRCSSAAEAAATDDAQTACARVFLNVDTLSGLTTESEMHLEVDTLRRLPGSKN